MAQTNRNKDEESAAEQEVKDPTVRELGGGLFKSVGEEVQRAASTDSPGRERGPRTDNDDLVADRFSGGGAPLTGGVEAREREEERGARTDASRMSSEPHGGEAERGSVDTANTQPMVPPGAFSEEPGAEAGTVVTRRGTTDEYETAPYGQDQSAEILHAGDATRDWATDAGTTTDETTPQETPGDNPKGE